MKTTDEFDEILSNALSEYREAEPLAGLEDRVLRRVQQQRERRKLCVAMELRRWLSPWLYLRWLPGLN